jgi:two-component system, chemotaxis family, sensor kinase CheA
MFISVKRHEREKKDLLGASNRLTDVLMKSSPQGLFLLDSKDKIQPQVSASLALMFRRQDFANLSLDKLIAPLVSAKVLSGARAFLTRLCEAPATFDPTQPHPLQDLEVRLANPDGSNSTAHYSFDFSPIGMRNEPRTWLVRVTDITARVQQQRELEDLRTQMQTQGEILRSVLQLGATRFGAFLQRTDASMETINAVLKKPAREAGAFRNKLEETLDEVDRLRRDATALKLSGFTAAARLLEDSLHELRSRGELSGSDFLPLAVKLDQLYGQFALLRSLASQAGSTGETEAASPEERMSENGTQIIEAPKFLPQKVKKSTPSKAHRVAQAGSLDSTLTALTELVAQEHNKTVVLDCSGMQLVPARYQATIKNVAIQLIRNAVMHGIEAPAQRESLGKPKHGTLHLEFKVMPDQSFELHCQDDGAGLDPEKVRATAVARGLLTADAAARLRDRQLIKLIFKSGYTTLETTPGAAPHGAGMSLVRRYVHESGGKIALASLLGHETRFKLTLPALDATNSQSGTPPADAQVA